MDDFQKQQQLTRHKLWATGLFVLMAVLFLSVTFYLKNHNSYWLGFVKAFTEAAMVGALADWFAVTALFNYPMGLPIPHTNLIENSKKRIGDNLGNFVVNNFLTQANIRPYIEKLKISGTVGHWLVQPKNATLVIEEAGQIVLSIVNKISDEQAVVFLKEKSTQVIHEIPLPKIAANLVNYFIVNKEIDGFITAIAKKLEEYILQNDKLVTEKVKQESYFFIPGFVDKKLAAKITSGLANYFKDIADDPTHRVREDILAQLHLFERNLREDPKWEDKFLSLKQGFANGSYLNTYVESFWKYLKTQLQIACKGTDGIFLNYLKTNLHGFATELQNDPTLQTKIDSWVRFTLYKYILQNSNEAGLLISNTVGTWQGRALSKKLELEVGKDLQFIRINGTLVGGLVGLIIYIIELAIA